VQTSDRNVGAAELDLGEKTARKTGLASQLIEGESATGADNANFFAELLQVSVHEGNVSFRKRTMTPGAELLVQFLG